MVGVFRTLEWFGVGSCAFLSFFFFYCFRREEKQRECQSTSKTNFMACVSSVFQPCAFCSLWYELHKGKYIKNEANLAQDWVVIFLFFLNIAALLKKGSKPPFMGMLHIAYSMVRAVFCSYYFSSKSRNILILQISMKFTFKQSQMNLQIQSLGLIQY